MTTKELTEELSNQEGVETLYIKPYDEVTITTGGSEKKIIGPAVILINID